MACLHGHAMCLGLGCLTMWAALALVACLGLGSMPIGAALALVACLGPGNLLALAAYLSHGYGYVLYPWLWLRALAFATCLWGLPRLALAVCPSLGSMPMGAALTLPACPSFGNMPGGATLAMASCLELVCASKVIILKKSKVKMK